MFMNIVERIREALPHCLTKTNIQNPIIQAQHQGKVRDTYDLGDRLAIVTTDRQSAFDRVLACVPFKGQVLNQCSQFWFEQTQEIMANHMLSVPDPNVMMVKKCRVFPVEFVVRGYMTGTTSTSIWTQYQKGVRDYCGHQLVDGLVKNQALACPIITPTTKAIDHDEVISPQDIVGKGLMSAVDWEYASRKALELFAFGQQLAAKQGLILVDTKYEMGVDESGEILLVDEVHTPDSSRYWMKSTYEQRIAKGLEPENFDKEFLRLWFVDHCDPYHDDVLPQAPDDLVVELSRRYIEIYEKITGKQFAFPGQQPVQDRLEVVFQG
jgi:phosphoribosylaminoimidazole-succinocarboxamide synthase